MIGVSLVLLVLLAVLVVLAIIATLTDVGHSLAGAYSRAWGRARQPRQDRLPPGAIAPR